MRRAQDENNDTLRSYDIGGYIARTGGEVFNFAFSKPIISVQLGYGAVLGTTVLQGNRAISVRSTSRASAGSIAQIIAVYWFNGQNFIRISDPVPDVESSALRGRAQFGNVYQIRAARIANQFQLSQGSPYPRVITSRMGRKTAKYSSSSKNPTGRTSPGNHLRHPLRR